MLRTLLCIFTLVSISSTGCRSQKKDPAVVAYQQLVSALARADVKAATQRLAPASRKVLRRLAAGGGVKPSQGLEAIFSLEPGWGFERDLPSTARVVEGQGTDDRRIVRGPIEGKEWLIPVVRGEDGWQVDLFAARPHGEGEAEP